MRIRRKTLIGLAVGSLIVGGGAWIIKKRKNKDAEDMCDMNEDFNDHNFADTLKEKDQETVITPEEEDFMGAVASAVEKEEQATSETPAEPTPVIEPETPSDFVVKQNSKPMRERVADEAPTTEPTF